MRINLSSNMNFQGLWESKINRYRGSDRNFPHTVIDAKVSTYRPFKDEEITPELQDKIEQEKSYYCKYWSNVNYYSYTEKDIQFLKTVLGKPLEFTEEEYKNLSTTLKNAKRKLQTLRETIPQLENMVKYVNNKSLKDSYSAILEKAKEDLKNTSNEIRKLEEITDKYLENNPFEQIKTERTQNHEYTELPKWRTEEVAQDVNWERKLPQW